MVLLQDSSPCSTGRNLPQGCSNGGSAIVDRLTFMAHLCLLITGSETSDHYGNPSPRFRASPTFMRLILQWSGIGQSYSLLTSTLLWISVYLFSPFSVSTLRTPFHYEP
jgi:hypothetical protein